jgi:hypothetical protein
MVLSKIFQFASLMYLSFDDTKIQLYKSDDINYSEIRYLFAPLFKVNLECY